MFPGGMFEYMAEYESAYRREGVRSAARAARLGGHNTTPHAGDHLTDRVAHWLGHRLVVLGERLHAWSEPAAAPRAYR